jgi:imidazoleglycerol-phosphate dehydratase
MRTANIQRDTKETRISGKLKIEGRGRYDISTGIRFFDHMLELFTKHGGFDLTLKADGDLDVDQHHTVEDVGILLGQLFQSVRRSQGHQPGGLLHPPHGRNPRLVAVDLGGRPRSSTRIGKVRLVGDLQTELAEDFFGGFVHHAGANLHARSCTAAQPPQAGNIQVFRAP